MPTIHDAAADPSPQGFQRLCDYVENKKVDINSLDSHNFAAIHCAAHKGSLRNLIYLLNKKPNLSQGENILRLALLNSDKTLSNYLGKKILNEDIHVTEFKDGTSKIHAAIVLGDLNFLQTAIIDEQTLINKNNETLLDWTIWANQPKILYWMINNRDLNLVLYPYLIQAVTHYLSLYQLLEAINLFVDFNQFYFAFKTQLTTEDLIHFINHSQEFNKILRIYANNSINDKKIVLNNALPFYCFAINTIKTMRKKMDPIDLELSIIIRFKLTELYAASAESYYLNNALTGATHAIEKAIKLAEKNLASISAMEIDLNNFYRNLQYQYLKNHHDIAISIYIKKNNFNQATQSQILKQGYQALIEYSKKTSSNEASFETDLSKGRAKRKSSYEFFPAPTGSPKESSPSLEKRQTL